MNAIVNASAEIVNDDFFAPVSTDLIDTLIANYRKDLGNIEKTNDFFASAEYKSAAQWFVDHHNMGHVDKEAAIANLNAWYWQSALNKTDVLSCMPRKRIDEWNKVIHDKTAPAFEENVVRETIYSLLNQRGKFFAERVDGVFRVLSGDHVTNSPMGFNKRMIINYCLDKFYYVQHSRAGYVQDLMVVICKILGREAPDHGYGYSLIQSLVHSWGEWFEVMGGVFKIKLFMKGTVHIEIHPDIAWQLNKVLAMLYPQAIPAAQRQKPAKKAKDYKMIMQPLPFPVLTLLREGRIDKNTFSFRYHGTAGKAVLAMTGDVLKSIGGVERPQGFVFDYDVSKVIRMILITGCLPEQKSHQFYPTPESVAINAVELAEIDGSHVVGELSAGQGGLADWFPPVAKKVLVEISGLHCEILRQKHPQATVVHGDCVEWAETAGISFDRIVINPPFSEGRAELHVKTAFKMLKKGGRLVAIIPASYKGKTIIEGVEHGYTRIYANEFADTSVSVVILVLNKE